MLAEDYLFASVERLFLNYLTILAAGLVNLDDGSQRWQRKTKVTPLSLAASASSVVYHDGDAIVCLDLANGKPRWTSAPVARRQAILQSTGVTLVLYDDLVLFTGDDVNRIALLYPLHPCLTLPLPTTAFQGPARRSS